MSLNSKPKINIPPKATAIILFPDKTIYFGKAIGTNKEAFGEICFNTSSTGYQEVLSDPSYHGQIINFTFPHIGNVGTNEDDIEAVKVYASGLILRNDITNPSNYRSEHHLNDWLITHNVTGICGVDTRAITKDIRLNGACNIAITHFFDGKLPNIDKLAKKLSNMPNQDGMELAKNTSVGKTYVWGKAPAAKYKVVAVDYGAKLNILRCLVNAGCEVVVVPAITSFDEIMSHKPDGVFLSNGPGDPAATGKYAIEVINKIIEANIPLFGICLGHQLLALATGAKTEKMHQGHRGANHPVKDLFTDRVSITSQNHGFVVKADSLPSNVIVTHISLFDNSIEGIKIIDKPAFSVQYHPESSPGPHDSLYLFDRFINMIKQHQ